MKILVIAIAVILLESSHIQASDVNQTIEVKPTGKDNTPEKRSIGGMLLPLLGGLMGSSEDSFGSNGGNAAGGLLSMIGSLLSNRMGLGGGGGGGGLKIDVNNKPPLADNFGSSSNSYSGNAPPSPGIALNLDFGKIHENLEKGLRIGKAAMSTGGSLLSKILQAQSSNAHYDMGPPPPQLPKEHYPEPPSSLRSGHIGVPPRYGRQKSPSSAHLGVRGSSAENGFSREPIYIREQMFSSRPKAPKSYDYEHQKDYSDVIIGRNPQYSDSATAHQPFYSESPKNSPAIYPENLRSSPSSYSGGLRSSPSSYSEGLRSSPSMYSEGIRSSPSSYSEGIRNNPSSFSEGIRNSPSMYSEGIRSSPSSFPEGIRSSPSMYSEGIRNSPSYFEGVRSSPSHSEEVRSNLPSYSEGLRSSPPYSESLRSDPEDLRPSPASHQAENLRSNSQTYTDGSHGSYADYQEIVPAGSQEIHSDENRYRSHQTPSSASAENHHHQRGYPEENEISAGIHQREEFGSNKQTASGSYRSNNSPGQEVPGQKMPQTGIQQVVAMPIGVYESSQNFGSSVDKSPASEYGSSADYDQSRYGRGGDGSDTRDYDGNFSGSQSAGRVGSGYVQQP